MTDIHRHEIPLEPALEPGKRSGEGASSIVPHLQQQVQATVPAELEPEPYEPQTQDGDQVTH